MAKLTSIVWLLFAFLTTQLCTAAVIRYDVVDLPDPAVVPGEDHWQYRYVVSDFVFETDQGFSIFFDPDRYDDLQDPPPAVGGDWDIQVFQPDTGIPDDGFYDGVAQVDSPSLATTFVVNFVWQGAGLPGSQSFEIFDTDFSTLETGQTVLVPEPSAWVLVVAMTTVLFCRRKMGLLTSITYR